MGNILCYGKNFKSGIIFSSELKALSPKVKINIDNNTIWEYLSLNYNFFDEVKNWSLVPEYSQKYVEKFSLFF